MTARPWETHPALANVAERWRADLLRMIETPLASPHIAAHCGTTVEIVAAVREAKRAAMEQARQKRKTAASKAQRQAEREGRTGTPFVPMTKPCGCGAEGCEVVQRPGQKPWDHRRQTYASLRCAMIVRNRKPESEPVGAAWMQHPILSTLTATQSRRLVEMVPSSITSALAAERLKIPVDVVETVRRARTMERAKELKRAWWERQKATKVIASLALGSPQMFLARLRAVHPRGEGEPTRETLHEWAAMHSGKREWSTSDVARLRAPTLVRHSIAGDAA